MTKIRLSIMAAIGQLAIATNAIAVDAISIDWDDLVPGYAPLDDPLEEVDLRTRFDIAFAAQVRTDIANGLIETSSPEAMNAAAVEGDLSRRGVDAERLISAFASFNAELARRNVGLAQDLVGERVSLPGYALPLELSAGGVREFLLVPYVGACIHVPPPPPNQMVYVGIDGEVEIDGLFQAVEVTGILEVETADRPLYLVDGSADISTGYTLNDVQVVLLDD